MNREKVTSRKGFIFFAALGFIILMTLLSFAKCHYSFLSGAHCHQALDLPHIHPFANH
ncbi:MAG: hypothetical protein AAB490_05775 [Patescibacteria group bacterium]